MSASNKSKYLAIGTFAAGATPEQLTPFMSKEVPATLKIYVDGKMDQFWLRHDGKGVVFVMTTETLEEADALLKALPAWVRRACCILNSSRSGLSRHLGFSWARAFLLASRLLFLTQIAGVSPCAGRRLRSAVARLRHRSLW